MRSLPWLVPACRRFRPTFAATVATDAAAQLCALGEDVARPGLKTGQPLHAGADCGSVAAMSASRWLYAAPTFAATLAALVLAEVVSPPAASAENPAIAARQRVEKKTFTDSEIADGVLKTALGAEYHLAGPVARIRKYDVPVRFSADGANRPD